MLKKIVLCLLLVFLVSGCITEQDPINLIRNDSRVVEFLGENPEAEISTSIWAESFVENNIDEIREKCGSGMAVEKYLYFSIKKGDEELEGWLNKEGTEILCVQEKAVEQDECNADSECDDGDDCTEDRCSGSPKKCSNSTITACISGDGCCPSSCDYWGDDDCAAPLETCSEQGGEICRSDEICQQSFIDASDSTRCCPSACEEEPEELCDGVTCDPNKKCVDGGCVLKSCSEMGGRICPTDKMCSRITAFAAGTTQCCLGNCIEPVECSIDSECDDQNACTTDICDDSNNTCIYEDVTECVDGDGCCPENCNYHLDSDCSGKYCADIGIEIDGQLQNFKTGETITGLEGGGAFIGRQFSLNLFGVAKVDKDNYGILGMLEDFKGNNDMPTILTPNTSLFEVSPTAVWNYAYSGVRTVKTTVTLKTITIRDEESCTEALCWDGFCSEKENHGSCPEDCEKTYSGHCGSARLSVNSGEPFDQDIEGTYSDINNLEDIPSYLIYFDEIVSGKDLNFFVLTELRTLDGNVLEKAVVTKGNLLTHMFQKANDFKDEIEIAYVGADPATMPCEYIGEVDPLNIKAFVDLAVEGEEQTLEEGERIYGLVGRNNCPESLSMKFDTLTLGTPYPLGYGARFYLYDEQNSPIGLYGSSLRPPAQLRDVFLDPEQGDYCLDTNIFFGRAYQLVMD